CRNKKSLAIDLHDPRGIEIVLKLVAGADVFSENFKPGAMKRLGLGYDALRALNPALVYVSHKGFLPGPYEHRTALDEVVQMMGGLAYMTGPQGRPLRAGTSVNDIMGGMFGAIGAMAALMQRTRTGRGREVQSALFENNVLLVAQHMMQFAVTGKPADPMPSRISAWAVYDVFTVRNDEMIFLGVVTDTQWTSFCKAFGLTELAADPRLGTNNDRVLAREWLIPQLRELLAPMAAAQIARIFEEHALPYAPITRPQDLFEDPHLLSTGGLAPVSLSADASIAGRQLHTHLALLPLALDGKRLPLRSAPPGLGMHTRELLQKLGYDAAAIRALEQDAVVRCAGG
ncbi:MAG: CaiB/BaiF CoA-transferase family protein, partial [Quisquiliibacterium sp.]